MDDRYIAQKSQDESTVGIDVINSPIQLIFQACYSWKDMSVTR